MENTARKIPQGYMEDSQGRLVPTELVKEIDLARDELVREIVAAALRASQQLAEFKHRALADITAFVELSAEKYGVALGGDKGNIQLTTYDGAYRVRRDIAETLVFDERLQAAKALIDECIHEWSEGSCAEIRVLINDAFQVDKQGNINTTRVLGLRRLDISHPKWQQAMTAIGDSLQVAGTKAYLRLYQRKSDGGYEQISLDVATL